MRITSKKLGATTLAVVALGAVGIAEAAQTNTKLTIDADNGTFEGSLSSKKAKCEEGRKVTLSRKSGQTFKKIGSDVSNNDGDWTVDSEKTGKFRATVKANRNCKAATSKEINVTSSD